MPDDFTHQNTLAMFLASEPIKEAFTPLNICHFEYFQGDECLS
jgi:hypothetical protein